MTGARSWPLAGALWCLALAASAQDVGGASSAPRPAYTSSVDWARRVLAIDATVDLSGYQTVLPDARFRGEQAIEDAEPEMIQSALFPVRVDADDTVGSMARSSPDLMTMVLGVLTPADERYAVLSPDLRRLTVRYQIPLFPDVSSLLVATTQANPPQEGLGFVPSASFTGIVIYAKGPLPVHGEERSARLAPCLFPRVLDDQMNVIASAQTVDPDVLKARGVATYTDSTNEHPFVDLIGYNPLRTVATGLFGANPTDVIISRDAAREILANENNIGLIENAKILIIADLPPVAVRPAP